MAEQEAHVCPECGARLTSEQSQCELCGYVAGDQPASPGTPSEPDQPVGTIFCHQCGVESPSDARFCSSCGAKLQEGVRKATPPPSSKAKAASESAASPDEAQPTSASGPRSSTAVIMVSGVLFVVLLYLVTYFSKGAFTAEPPIQAQAPTVESAPPVAQTPQTATTAPALPAELTDQIATLEAEAEGLSGGPWIAKQTELLQLYLQAGMPDRAAVVQERIAQMSNEAADWIMAGSYYYDAMQIAGGQSRQDAAQRAVAAYEQALAITPNDLDLKIALAMAYLNTQAPMQGVMQIRSVLEEDPNHIQGNLYFGSMLMQINRVPQAQQQFEKVMQLADPTSPAYQQAELMLQNIRSVQPNGGS